MQVSSTVNNPGQKMLFQLMSKATQLAKTIKKENIFLIGQTRSGKSTAFNWIVDHKNLIGKGHQDDAVYQIINSNKKSAKIQEGYKSVTLIPNIFTFSQQVGFKFSKEVGLIDMPGFREQYNQAHVTTILSYIYQVFFKYSEKARFILVITNQEFRAKHSTKIFNLYGKFINLFKYKEMSKFQLTNLFRSVSLLVTSVPVNNWNKEQTKDLYLKIINKQLTYLKQLDKTAQIFPYIEMMLYNTADKRIVLFPKAKPKQTASPCDISFDTQSWQSCQLYWAHYNMQFTYAQKHQKLQSQQQSSLQKYFDWKIQHFVSLQNTIASFITNFLQKPLQICFYSLSEIHRKLYFFYVQNLIQDKQQRESQIELINQLSQVSGSGNPVLILKNILNLYKITSQSESLSTLQNLRNFFLKSFDYIIETFAFTKRQNYVMQKIKDCISKTFSYFMCLIQVQTSLEDNILYQLQELIKFVNACPYVQEQIINIFCKNINNQFQINRGEIENKIQKFYIQRLDQQEIDQFIQLLNDPQYNLRQRLLPINLFFQMSCKFHKLAAEKYKDVFKNRQSLKYYLQLLVDCVNLKILFNLEVSFNQRQKRDKIEQENKKLNADIQSAFYRLFIQILEVNSRNFQQLENLCKRSKICYLSKTYKRYYKDFFQMHTKRHEEAFLESHARISEEQYDYKGAIQIYQKCQKLAEYTYQKQIYYQKRVQLQKKNAPKCTKIQEIPADSYLSLAELVYSQILETNKIIPKSAQMQAYFKQKLKVKIKEQQFTVQLPKQLSNYDIIFYSKYLISKIKNRKTIIMIGNKLGKLAMNYSLRGKQLAKYGRKVDIKNRYNQQYVTINHQISQHNEVPNIYAINEIQLLVDAPHIYNEDPQKMLIIGHLLQQILVHSSQTKFLLAVSNTDILNNQCIPLVQNLQFFNNIFRNSQRQEKIYEILSLIVNYTNFEQNLQIRQAIKKLIDKLDQKKNYEEILQKYKLKKSMNPCQRIQIQSLVRKIYYRTIQFYLHAEKNKMRPPKIDDTYLSQNWKYLNEVSCHLRIGDKSFSNSLNIIQLQQDDHFQLLQGIRQRINLAKQVLSILAEALNNVYIFHRDPWQLKLSQKEIQRKLTDKYKLGKKFVSYLKKMAQKADLTKQLQYSEFEIPSFKQEWLAQFFNLLLTFRITVCSTSLRQSLQAPLQVVKAYFKKIYQIYMYGMSPFFTNIQLLRNTWLKIWQIVTQLQVFDAQTNLQTQNQLQKQIIYNYKLVLSSIVDIRQGLFITKAIEGRQSQELLQLFLEYLGLSMNKNRLEKQIPPETQPLDFIYKVLQTIREHPTYKTILNQKDHEADQVHRSIAKKLREIEKYFIEHSPNDTLTAKILYQQSFIYASQGGYFTYLFDRNKKNLQLTLRKNLEDLCVKLATFNFQQALKICNKLNNNTIKEKIYEKIKVKSGLTRDQFVDYYNLLMSKGNKIAAQGLLQWWKSDSTLSETQKKQMVIQKNQKESQCFIQKQLNLEQLYQIIKEINVHF